MPFSLAGVIALHSTDHVRIQRDLARQVPLLCREEPPPARAQLVLVENVLHGDGAEPDARLFELEAELLATPDRPCDSPFRHLLNHLQRRGLRMRLVNGRQVFQPFNPLLLVALLLDVELAAADAQLPAGFADVAQRLPEFQPLQPTVRQFHFALLGHRFAPLL